MSGHNGTKLSQRLHACVQDIWPRYLSHPFVMQMADGTLPKEKFRYYMVFDENDTGFDGAYPVREFMELMKKLYMWMRMLWLKISLQGKFRMVVLRLHCEQISP